MNSYTPATRKYSVTFEMFFEVTAENAKQAFYAVDTLLGELNIERIVEEFDECSVEFFLHEAELKKGN